MRLSKYFLPILKEKGVSNDTGKEFSVLAYHWFEFEDGKIISTGFNYHADPHQIKVREKSC